MPLALSIAVRQGLVISTGGAEIGRIDLVDVRGRWADLGITADQAVRFQRCEARPLAAVQGPPGRMVWKTSRATGHTEMMTLATAAAQLADRGRFRTAAEAAAAILGGSPVETRQCAYQLVAETTLKASEVASRLRNGVAG